MEGAYVEEGRELMCCMGVVNALQQQEVDRKMDAMDTAANAVRCKGDFVMYILGLLMISRCLCLAVSVYLRLLFSLCVCV